MKIRKTGSRGTKSYEDELTPMKWAGDSFRTEQKERLEKIGRNITMHLGRGIRTAKLKGLPESQLRPSTEGMTRITNRGTGSRKSTNKGN